MIAKELLDILACPACKTPVEEHQNQIICRQCGRKFPIQDGIPIMLLDQAQVDASIKRS